MTDGMFCAQYPSQYQEILSKMRLLGTRNCSKLGRSLYRLLEVQHWWFITNGPRETFSMLEMRSIILAPVALCDDVLLSVAIFLCWL